MDRVRPHDLPSEKLCVRCNQRKPSKDFYYSPLSDGLFKHCAQCERDKAKEKKKKLKEMAAEKFDLLKQGEHTRRIVAELMIDPGLKLKQLSMKLGIPYTTVAFCFQHNAYIKAVRMLATRKITEFVPLAVKGLEECLTSINNEVKFKTCLKVLETENIIGPSKLDISINDLSQKTTLELQQIIDQAKSIPKQTIEAELVQ